MEQRKSDINTGDGNVINVDNNGLNYSFDFSSQVAPSNEVPAAPAPAASAPVTPEVSVQPGVQPAPMPAAAPAPVQPAPAPEVSVPTEVTPMANLGASVSNEAVQTGNVQTPLEQGVSAEAPQVSNQAVVAEQAVSQEGVQPEAAVQVSNEQVQGSEGEIIKDKKSTKVFLFTIVGIIVAFIIALPFIRTILG